MNYIRKFSARKPSLIWNCEGKGKSLVIVKLTDEQYNKLQKTDPEDIKILKDSSEYKIVSMPKHKYMLRKQLI